jgi:hypothetical protein
VRATLAALVFAALAATGCVSMPSGGPVLSYPVTQGTAAQNQPYVQIQPQPPGANLTPKAIVEGFLTASASYGSYPQVVKEYLTPAEQRSWDPLWSAVVFQSGPNVADPIYTSTGKNPTTATVSITGKMQANLTGYGNYSVQSPSAPGGSPFLLQPFQLTKVGGQWRISSAPSELLLTSNSFTNDYQLRNLYFFDPQHRFLVPDPVYVPIRASAGSLMTGLVNELITPPPSDWLSEGATVTAFPPKTTVTGVTVDGGVTAVVNLMGAAIGKAAAGPAGNEVMERVSAQLLSTLSSGSTSAGVQSVEVVVNGHQWIPPDGQGNSVQPASKSKRYLATGTSPTFYYLTSAGDLTSQAVAGGKPVTLAKLGAGYAQSQIAVSSDGRYLAVLNGSTLYTGLVGGQLAKRGTGFLAMSWDVDDNLWASAAQGGQIGMFRATKDPRQPLGPMVPVDVQLTGTCTTLKVAPDGVRVAIVLGGDELTFGAISQQTTSSPRIRLSQLQETPSSQSQSATFTSLAWYGPDDVITLAEPGPAVTDYPISGGTPNSIQAIDGMNTISASYKEPFIASVSKSQMYADASLTGSWMTVTNGDTPVSGMSPTYPG